MEHLNVVTDMIWSNDWFASIDLTDAFFSVPIHKSHWKFLRFVWDDQLYQYKVMVFGLSTAPRIFTRICKPIVAKLHSELGISMSMYIDDTILANQSREKLKSHDIPRVIDIFESLGFYINYDKSVLQPAQSIVHLGFLINSSSCTIHIPPDKLSAIRVKCRTLLTKPRHIRIREVASLVGTLIAYSTGTKWGRLYYRSVERDKIKALKTNAGDFDKPMCLSDNAIDCISWWLTSDVLHPANFLGNKPDVVITSDASKLGWGGHRGSSTTGGRWNGEEANLHINYLELKAFWLTLQSLASDYTDITISAKLDNTCAISYLRNQGGIHEHLDRLAKTIWLWCKSRDIWLLPSYIPGALNCLADKKSRVFQDNTEWSLQASVYSDITKVWGEPEIDLFASRLNFKENCYVSWEPDPGSFWVDAFTLDWSSFHLCYAFPPFNLIGKVLSKAKHDKAELLLIAPKWPTQSWYPMLYDILTGPPNMLTLPRSKQAIYLPFDMEKVHPIWNRLNLCCYRISGRR